jgi:hypothetical protein
MATGHCCSQSRQALQQLLLPGTTMKEERRASRSVGWAAPPRVALSSGRQVACRASCERQYKQGRCLFHDLYLVTFLDFL